MIFLRDIPNVQILSGSSGAGAAEIHDDAYAISIQAPATLTASQAQVWVSVSSGPSATFAQLLSGGSAVVMAASQAIVISPLPYRLVRLQSTATGGEGATRTFLLAKLVHV